MNNSRSHLIFIAFEAGNSMKWQYLACSVAQHFNIIKEWRIELQYIRTDSCEPNFLCESLNA